MERRCTDCGALVGIDRDTAYHLMQLFGFASVSLLQRRMRVPFATARALLVELEKEGLVCRTDERGFQWELLPAPLAVSA